MADCSMHYYCYEPPRSAVDGVVPFNQEVRKSCFGVNGVLKSIFQENSFLEQFALKKCKFFFYVAYLI